MTSFTGYWLTRGRPHCLARWLQLLNRPGGPDRLGRGPVWWVTRSL
jgi:hypothetical protein